MKIIHCLIEKEKSCCQVSKWQNKRKMALNYFPHFPVVRCVSLSICPPTDGLEAKTFISQGSHVLTSALLITCRDGEQANENERVGGGRFRHRERDGEGKAQGRKE